jgi:hypothetical protein
VHALSCVLALSLALGPAPELPDVDDEPAASEPAAVEPAVSEPAASEVEPPAPEVAPAPVQPPPPTLEPATASEVVPASTRDRLGCRGSKSCKRMSVAGIVVGSLGLVGVGVGIGLLVNPDKVDPDMPINITSTHPPGLVSVTICSGFVLTSVLMLVAAHKGYYKDAQPSPKRKRGRAQLLPGGVGVQF